MALGIGGPRGPGGAVDHDPDGTPAPGPEDVRARNSRLLAWLTGGESLHNDRHAHPRAANFGMGSLVGIVGDRLLPVPRPDAPGRR
jgi:hypothetical protein